MNYPFMFATLVLNLILFFQYSNYYYNLVANLQYLYILVYTSVRKNEHEIFNLSELLCAHLNQHVLTLCAGE